MTPSALAAPSAALFIATFSASLAACPCRGSSGPGGALTTPLETLGGSFTQSALIVHGAWDPEGSYAALSDGNRQWQVDYGLALGWRAAETLEIGALLAYGRQSASAPGFASERTAFGDTTVRARWEAIAEPMGWMSGPPWPAVAIISSLRTPTGPVDRPKRANAGRIQGGTTGSVGASATSQGLGTWEPALAVELTRGLSAWWRVTAVGEIAVRLPDDSIGVDRQLGPRALGSLTLTHIPSPLTTVGVSTDLGWEDDVTLDARKRSGTTQRLWNVGAFLTLRLAKTGLRSGILVTHAPAVDSISVNAVGSTSLGVSLGYSM